MKPDYEIYEKKKKHETKTTLDIFLGISTFWQAADKLPKHECKLNQIKVVPSELLGAMSQYIISHTLY